MQEHHFLLLKKLKNTGSAQLCHLRGTFAGDRAGRPLADGLDGNPAKKDFLQFLQLATVRKI